MENRVNLNRWGRREFRAHAWVKVIVAKTIGVRLRDIRLLYLVIVLKPYTRSTVLRPSSTDHERVVVGGELYSPEQTRILEQALEKSRRGDLVLAAAENVHLGDVRGGHERGEICPVRRLPGGAVVDVVSLWWSVCRGCGVLGDGGAGGLLIGDGLVLGAGGEQCGDGEAVAGRAVRACSTAAAWSPTCMVSSASRPCGIARDHGPSSARTRARTRWAASIAPTGIAGVLALVTEPLAGGGGRVPVGVGGERR